MNNTTGMQLIKSLGLEKIYQKTGSIYIARVLLPVSQKVNIIFYNSIRSMSKGEALRHGVYPGMIYSGLELSREELEFNHTPLMNLDKFNGQLETRLFVTVDCAFQKHLHPKKFSRLPEGKSSIKMIPSFYIGKEKLKELTLGDLRDKGNISDFTMTWRKDKNRTTGTENTIAKLVDVFINEPDDSMTVVFQTKATELNGKEPNKNIDSNYKFYKEPKERISPLNKSIMPNSEKTYEVQLKFLNFSSWLETHPEGEPITPKDVKEILEVSDIQLFSSSPAWLYQGFMYWNTQLGTSIVPETRKPKRWDKVHGDGQAFLTKELYGILGQMSFFLNPIASKLTKRLKDTNY